MIKVAMGTENKNLKNFEAILKKLNIDLVNEDGEFLNIIDILRELSDKIKD